LICTYYDGCLPFGLGVHLGMKSVLAWRYVFEGKFTIGVCGGKVRRVDYDDVCLHVAVDFTVEANVACFFKGNLGNGCFSFFISTNVKSLGPGE